MPRRDPTAEVKKALDRSADARLVRVLAGDVVTLCDLPPADDDLSAATLRRGCAAVPADTWVVVTAGDLMNLLERLPARASVAEAVAKTGNAIDAAFDATAEAFKESAGG